MCGRDLHVKILWYICSQKLRDPQVAMTSFQQIIHMVSKTLCDRGRFIWFLWNRSNCHETSFKRLKPTISNYKNNKSFGNKIFREELLYELLNATFANCFEGFIDVCQKNFKSSCFNQQEYVRGNLLPFWTKLFQKQ